MELAAAVAGLTLLGYWVDYHFETRPWGVLIGVAVGLVGGLYNMVKAVLAEVPSDPQRSPENTAGSHAGKPRKRTEVPPPGDRPP